MITNYKKLIVPEIKDLSQPYNGQFIQIDVLDVK
jgi:hypothetical protein